MHPRLRPLLPLLAALPWLGGCYLSHRLPGADGPNPEDGGTPTDASIPLLPDGAPADGGVDAGADGGSDAGPDIEPVEEPPPPPGVCRTDPVIEPFEEPVLERRWPPNGVTVTHETAKHVLMTPIVVDLVPGEVREPQVIFVSFPAPRSEVPRPGGILRIWDLQTNTTISYPAENGERGVLEMSSNLAAGDLDGDGESEIVGVGNGFGTYAWEADGTLKWSSPHPTALERGTENPSIGGAPAIADLDGDGNVEVIVGRSVLAGSDGALQWVGPRDGSTKGHNRAFLGPLACVADIDGDGDQEVIAGPTAFEPDGEIIWYRDDLPDGLCGIAEMDEDSEGPEIVLVARGYLRVLRSTDGGTIFQRALAGGLTNPVGGPPTIADFDGDGFPEIGVAHAGAYGVYDIACEADGIPEGCRGFGIVWSAETEDISSAGTGSSVFDFNGDGRAEVIYNDEYTFRVFDGTTGDRLVELPNSSQTRTENPVIVDVDNDGDAEIVFSSNAAAPWLLRDRATDPGVEIWGDRRGRWVGARRIWNQHAYSITNVEEDGAIPARPQPHWEFLNAFRQNLREDEDVLATPDLWGGRGDYECIDDGRARLVIHVQNFGLERVGAGVVVGIYRGWVAPENRVGEIETTRTLEPEGDGEFLEFEVELGDDPRESWVAVLDDPVDVEGGVIAECREDNNEVLVWRPDCSAR